MPDLTRLFAPRSIAVVGASTAPDKAGSQMLRTLRGFEGRLYPIHPKAERILDLPAFPTLGAVNAPLDLAVLVIPPESSVDALAAAASAGCGAAIIVSGGFGEAGGDGLRRQDELTRICRTTGIRLLGPNTSGFVNTRARVFASFAPGLESITTGDVGVVAQSGGVNLSLAFLLERLGRGVSIAVGLGNAIDVDAADALEYLADDPHTRAIALHLEGVTNGRKLFESLRRTTPHKPVVVLAVGRADVGAFAASHTGNLIGDHARKIAALRQAGAVVVDTTDALADAAAALALRRIAPKSRPGVGLLTGQAGPALVIVDQLKSNGVAVPEVTEPTRLRIESLLPPMTFTRNPIDTGRPGPSFGAVLEAMAEDPMLDALAVYALHEPAAVDPVATLGAVAARSSKPVLFGTLGLDDAIAPSLRALWNAGVPAYTSPDRLASAVRALVEDAHAAARRPHAIAPAPLPAEPIRAALDEHGAKNLLAGYGIATPRRLACRTQGEARRALEAIGAPVAVKILSASIAHKTEAGGVHLDIRDRKALDAALDRLETIPLAGERAYLVEAMAAPGLELIVGAVRDPSFGPVVAIGAGGVLAEVLADTAVRLAPLTEQDALEMLDELRGARLLDGFRGMPAVDRRAIAACAVALGRCLTEHPEIEAIEINPLRAYPDTALALDALIVLAR